MATMARPGNIPETIKNWTVGRPGNIPETIKNWTVGRAGNEAAVHTCTCNLGITNK